jgi:DedD protein
MASSAPPDPENSTLKRRARRRLIGSIALVLVAVIALPMIFDDEKKPLDQDVSVQIPNQEAVVVRPGDPKGVKGKTVEPKEPKSAVPETPARLESPPVDAKVPAPVPAEAVKEAPKAPAKADVKAEAKPEPKSTLKAEPKTEPKAEPKAVPSKAEEARVKAILDGAIAKEAAAKEAASGFAVQIGAFATEDKIREAREKLGGAGFKSYTEKLDTKDGERTRVRAGPFASRDAADAARDKIRALGFASAAVVAK